MKRFFGILTIFLFVLYSSACSNQSGQNAIETNAEIESEPPTENNIIVENQFPQLEINFPTLEEVQEEYPEKTVLVWVIEETGYERNNPFRTREINQYLASKGHDFAVCFYPIRAFENSEQTDYYTTHVEDMVKQGEQADIIYSSFTYIEEAGNNAYHKYVYNGLFEPLERYLDTEVGKKLYALMPEKHWDGMKVNGGIYGLDGTMTTLSDDYGYYVNAELADKYGFDITKSIDEQIDVLKKVNAEENKCDVFAVYGYKLGRASYLSDIKEITQAVYWDEKAHTAKCVLDNPVYTERLNFLHGLVKDGLLVNMDVKHSDTFFIMQGNKTGGRFVYDFANPIDVDYFDRKIKVYPVFKESSSVRNCYMATGICTASENKEKAFELLALTHTDPYLNNLLTFGSEGTDYSLSDNRVDTIVNPVSLDRFPNKMICNQYEGSISANEYREIYNNAVVHSDTDFAFDGRGLVDETYATSLIMMEYTLPSADKSLEESLSELRSSLEAAGLQKVIDECNRQYNEIYLQEKENENR